MLRINFQIHYFLRTRCKRTYTKIILYYVQSLNRKIFSFSGETINVHVFVRLQVVLGMGVCNSPKHVPGRLLLVSCSAAFFVIVSLFQASMVTKLSIETGQKEIDTLKELDESGMEIRTSLVSVRDSLAMYSHTKTLADKIDLEKNRRDRSASKFVFTARIQSLNIIKFSNYDSQSGNASLHIVRVNFPRSWQRPCTGAD